MSAELANQLEKAHVAIFAIESSLIGDYSAQAGLARSWARIANQALNEAKKQNNPGVNPGSSTATV